MRNVDAQVQLRGYGMARCEIGRAAERIGEETV